MATDDLTARVEAIRARRVAIDRAAWGVGIRSNYSNYYSHSEVIIHINRLKDRNSLAPEYDLTADTAEMEDICRTDLSVTRAFIENAAADIDALLQANEQLEATLIALVEDMGEAEWTWLSHDLTHQIVTALGDKTEKTRRWRELVSNDDTAAPDTPAGA